LALVLFLTGCHFKPAGPELVDDSKKVTAAGKGLEFSLPTHPGGEAYKLAAHRGQVVLIDVWATWCEPCRDALPLYQDFANEFRSRGLEVVTINVDQDAEGIAPFLASAKVNLPVLRDPDGHFVEPNLKVKLMPTAFLVDKSGVVRFVHEGFDESQLSTWLAEIESLLAEKWP
jgi:thiol-disulfide isomerase/thioredoxin